jgi:hypothetical protein
MNTTLRKWLRVFRAKTFGYRDIHQLADHLKNLETYKLNKNASSSKILFATSLGGELASVKLESMLAIALQFNDYECEFLLCDGILPACQLCTYAGFNDHVGQFVKEGPQKLFCPSCYKDASKAIESLGFGLHTYSQHLNEKDIEKIKSTLEKTSFDSIPDYCLDDVPVGEHALAGALRFMTRSTITQDKQGKDVLQRYFEAALLTAYVIKNILNSNNIRCVVVNHGIYVPHGITVQVARSLGVPVVVWNVSYRKNTFIFSHDDTYHHTLMSEPVSVWEGIEWNEEKEDRLRTYLQSRLKGTGDWITFQNEKNEINNNPELGEFLGDNSTKCVSLLTNVLWDAQVHYRQNAFPNMLEWIIYTIEYFKTRPDLKLIIRVHPAEVRNLLPSKQQVVDEISKKYPELPNNILLIPPLSPITSYEVALRSCCCLIYGTKMGVELSVLGIPVIVAGEAWIRNKGLTYDVSSRSEYINILNKIPDDKKYYENTDILRAKKYAYHFFFRRMLEIKLFEPAKGWPPYKLPDTISGDDIKNSAPLKCILNGIVLKSNFILD